MRECGCTVRVQVSGRPSGTLINLTWISVRGVISTTTINESIWVCSRTQTTTADKEGRYGSAVSIASLVEKVGWATTPSATASPWPGKELYEGGPVGPQGARRLTTYFVESRHALFGPCNGLHFTTLSWPSYGMSSGLGRQEREGQSIRPRNTGPELNAIDMILMYEKTKTRYR